MFMDEQPWPKVELMLLHHMHNAKGLHAKGNIQISLATDHYNEHTMQRLHKEDRTEVQSLFL